MVHSTMCNAPYIHLSRDSIFELWRTFPNANGRVHQEKTHINLGSMTEGSLLAGRNCVSKHIDRSL